MGWLRRTGPPAPGEADEEERRKAAGPPEVERSAPGIAALFADLNEDGSHAVLDLGSATETNFGLYGRYARRIRFADLLTAPMRGEPWAGALRSLPDPVPVGTTTSCWRGTSSTWSRPKSRPLVVAPGTAHQPWRTPLLPCRCISGAHDPTPTLHHPGNGPSGPAGGGRPSPRRARTAAGRGRTAAHALRGDPRLHAAPGLSGVRGSENLGLQARLVGAGSTRPLLPLVFEPHPS